MAELSDNAIALLVENKEEGQILCMERIGNGGWQIGSGKWDYSVLQELIDAGCVSEHRNGDYHTFTTLGEELAAQLS